MVEFYGHTANHIKPPFLSTSIETSFRAKRPYSPIQTYKSRCIYPFSRCHLSPLPQPSQLPCVARISLKHWSRVIRRIDRPGTLLGYFVLLFLSISYKDNQKWRAITILALLRRMCLFANCIFCSGVVLFCAFFCFGWSYIGLPCDVL